MRAFVLPVIVFLLSAAAPVEARPSLRAIRSGAERFAQPDAGWRMKFFSLLEEEGIRAAYPASWLAPKEESAGTYRYFRLLPHDLATRRNRILELSVRVFGVGKTFTAAELNAFARAEAPKIHAEFWIREARETAVGGHPAWDYRMETMSGERQDVWISAGTRVIVFGYRSLLDSFAQDKEFFFDPFVASAVLTEPAAARPPARVRAPESGAGARCIGLCRSAARRAARMERRGEDREAPR